MVEPWSEYIGVFNKSKKINHSPGLTSAITLQMHFFSHFDLLKMVWALFRISRSDCMCPIHLLAIFSTLWDAVECARLLNGFLGWREDWFYCPDWVWIDLHYRYRLEWDGGRGDASSSQYSRLPREDERPKPPKRPRTEGDRCQGKAWVAGSCTP